MSSPHVDSPLQPLLPATNSSTTNGTLQKRKLLCLTVCGYRKPGLTEEEYGEYMSKKHSKVVRPIMAKYGVLRWTHVCDLKFFISIVQKNNPSY